MHVRIQRIVDPRGVRQTWAAEGAGEKSDGPVEVVRLATLVADEPTSPWGAFRGVIGVGEALANFGSGTGPVEFRARGLAGAARGIWLTIGAAGEA